MKIGKFRKTKSKTARWHMRRSDFAIFAKTKYAMGRGGTHPHTAPVVELRDGAWYASLNAPNAPYIGPCENKREAMKLARMLYLKHPLFDYINENMPLEVLRETV